METSHLYRIASNFVAQKPCLWRKTIFITLLAVKYSILLGQPMKYGHLITQNTNISNIKPIN